MCENIFDREKIWQQVTETMVLGNHSDENVKNFIINMLINHFEEMTFDRTYLDTCSIKDKEIQHQCFFVVCMFSPDPRIISKIIHNFQIDMNYVDDNDDNFLTLACWKNTNLEIIKYLINDLGSDTNHVNRNGDNCLTLACWQNTNLEIIKYLINDLGMDVNKMDIYGDNCLTLACKKNTNLEIIKYLIESTDAILPFFHNLVNDLNLYEIWKKIIRSLSKNFNRFRDILSMGLGGMGVLKDKDDLMDFLKTLNPLLLMGVNHPMQGFDPMDQIFRFNDYVKYVDELQSFIVPIPPDPASVSSSHCNPIPWMVSEIDFRKKPSMLFHYNGTEYYGSRELVFESICCLKEITDVANFDQPITLSGSLPEYVINLWIRSMYSQRFDLMDIRLDDLVQFLIHVDQYPTNLLTICTLEYDLIKYLDALDQRLVSKGLVQSLKQISVRCKLKRLYLWIHNKEKSQNDEMQ
jgi:hypothetical protein